MPFPTRSTTTWDTFLSYVLAVQFLCQQIVSSYLPHDHLPCNESQMIRQSSTSEKSKLIFLYEVFYICLYLKNVVLKVYLNVSLTTDEF